jgi:hypothetical protein
VKHGAKLKKSSRDVLGTGWGRALFTYGNILTGPTWIHVCSIESAIPTRIIIRFPVQLERFTVTVGWIRCWIASARLANRRSL